MFESYMRDAFAPIGVMIEFWEEQVRAASSVEIDVVVTNDLQAVWNGRVKLKLIGDGKEQPIGEESLSISSHGQRTVSFSVAFPHEPGAYELIAERISKNGESIRSRRELSVRAE